MSVPIRKCSTSLARHRRRLTRVIVALLAVLLGSLVTSTANAAPSPGPGATAPRPIAPSPIRGPLVINGPDTINLVEAGERFDLDRLFSVSRGLVRITTLDLVIVTPTGAIGRCVGPQNDCYPAPGTYATRTALAGEFWGLADGALTIQVSHGSQSATKVVRVVVDNPAPELSIDATDISVTRPPGSPCPKVDLYSISVKRLGLTHRPVSVVLNTTGSVHLFDTFTSSVSNSMTDSWWELMRSTVHLVMCDSGQLEISAEADGFAASRTIDVLVSE
jgi:hypothetical protein